ncbi:hypothetical protein SynPROS91_00911 [Synechococcus sp. PROS-9-1]|nr:hypothetical protein SynPROS91_00911 [Synechococcus sp. PROS-9-1]
MRRVMVLVNRREDIRLKKGNQITVDAWQRRPKTFDGC